LILVNSLVPALLAGNSVIIKPSPQTPTVAERMHVAFAGVPDGVIRVLHCGTPPVIQALVQRPEIKLVCFTGSVAGGLAVQQAGAARVDVRVGLELGGNDPAYVRADVDVEWAAAQIIDGALYNSGQSCCAVERVYVAAEIHDEFVRAAARVLEGYVLGDPASPTTNLGPVVSRAAVANIQRQVADAVGRGAAVVSVENSSFTSYPPQGNYVAPVVLVDVDHDMAVMKEETFGPVIPIMKVADDREAIALMNDSEYGLSASIWTKDVELGHRLAEQVDAGTVFVNRCDYPSPVRPLPLKVSNTDRGRISHGRAGRTRGRDRRSVASGSTSS
jgi:acyl-CoA reductase-like NAD-dependent aldehyde dehydrogenase